MMHNATIRTGAGFRRSIRPRTGSTTLRAVSHRRHMGQAAAAALGLSSAATAGIGAAVQLATSAISMWMGSIQLSHDADTATTLIVNGLAQQLQNLDNAYLAEPPSCASQRAALDAYDQAWLWLQSPAACGNPSYGSAGNRCITDRAPGGPVPWQTYYRDPIANDPRLAGQGCDTSQEVILPSLTTGTYAASGITAGGQLDTTVTGTAAPAAASAAASPGSTISVVPATALSSTSSVSPLLLYGAMGLVAAFFLLR